MITIRTTQNVETRMTNNHDGSTTFEMRFDKTTSHLMVDLLENLRNQNLITSYTTDNATKRVFSGFGFEIEIPVDESKS